jgi:hypothetical protein
MWIREIAAKLLINRIMRTRTRYFRHAYHPTRDNTIIRDDKCVPNLYKFLIQLTLIVRHIYSFVQKDTTFQETSKYNIESSLCGRQWRELGGDDVIVMLLSYQYHLTTRLSVMEDEGTCQHECFMYTRYWDQNPSLEGRTGDIVLLSADIIAHIETIFRPLSLYQDYLPIEENL